ncbi:TonB-dependent receptor [Gangjinia marincola]|uniref:TonB-dependent receptor n=2 Tax=Gangjinia marincola TaxID=578463 RepID=A0ABP3XY87_9FLAO
MICGLLFLIPLGTFAQTKEITGTVTGSDGIPIPGVNMFLKGTSRGTSTNFDGEYSITVPQEGATLVFSYVGFKKQEVAVGEQNVINVSLEEQTNALDEVVVIGYGQEEREDLIGAVSTVQGESIERQQVASFEQALIGQVSGVQFRENGGPDGGPELIIRGLSTFGNNTPLYVVDGFIIGTNVGEQRDNYILNAINPADIESISILKDAASKAIYGSRAAAGVVIITTKKGAFNQKPTITFGSNLGIQSVPDYEAPPTLNAQELYEYQLDFYDDIDFYPNINLGPAQQNQRAFLLGLEDIGPNTNWWELITRDALVENYNIGVQGGTNQSRYNISLATQEREGVLKNTDFTRYSFNFNFNTQISKKLQLGLNIAPTRTIGTGTGTNSNSGDFRIYSVPALAYWTDPTAENRDEDGELIPVAQGNLIWRTRNANPLAKLELREAERRNDLYRISGFLDYEILDGLKFRTFPQVQIIDRRITLFTPSRLPGDNLFVNPLGTQRASASVDESNFVNAIWENTLTYNKRLGSDKKHSVNALAGYILEHRESRTARAASNFLVDEEIQLPSASNSVEPQNFTGGSGGEANALITYMGRLNYDFDQRYYLTATVRVDGSSKFGLNNQYALFPSAGVAWRVSNESFFKSIKETFSELKLEAGYGVSGNNNIGNYVYQGSVGVNQDYNFGGVNAPGATVSGLPNFDTVWEESNETNFGIDLGFFNNRIFLGADYYRINTTDFLFPRELPIVSGFGSVIDNLGEIRNEGFEIEFKAEIIQKQDFNWYVGFNFFTNENEVIDVPQELGFFFPAGSGMSGINITEVREGQALGIFRGLEVTGLFTQEDLDNPDQPKYPGDDQEVGSLKFKDQLTIDTDGDGIPDQADGVLNKQDVAIIGDPNPDFVFGFNTRINYKNLDFSITADGAIGQQILPGQNQYLWNQDDGQFNIDRAILDRFRPGDDPTTKVFPGTGSIQSRRFFRTPNTLWIQDADYFWIRNITLGYRLQDKVFEKLFNSARIYVSAQNPFLFTEYEYGAPTVNRAADVSAVRNVDNGAYPLSRTITVGFDVTF